MSEAREEAAGGVLSAVVWGGLGAGVGDSILALVLYRVPLAVIYRSVASGLLGRAAFRGGLATAALGCVLHFTIATTAAAVYVTASRPIRLLRAGPVPCGLVFGVAVYFFMKYVVVPLSAVPRLTPFDPLAMAGHAFLVGLPIALAAASASHRGSEGTRKSSIVARERARGLG